MRERLTSLDVFRGATIAGMMLVNNPGDWANIYGQLEHASWHGWTFTDMIFPFFLFIVGVAIMFVIPKKIESGKSKSNIFLTILKRSFLIYLFGFFLSGFPYFNLSTIRVVGVLQRISFCYLAVALIVLYCNKKGRVAILLFVLFFYWIVMAFYPVPEIGAGLFEKGKNFSNWLDSQLLSGHMWSQTKTWDPEGIFSTLPAIGTTLFGTFCGEYLLSTKHTKEEKTIWMFIVGSALLFLGVVFDNFLPINKSLWTTSYSVFMAGWAFVILAILYFLIDLKGYKNWTKPFIVFGLNPMVAFVSAGVVARCFGLIKIGIDETTKISLHKFLYTNYFVPIASPINASLAWAICFMMLMYFICWVLWKKKIVFRV